jgi:hypothetical protein
MAKANISAEATLGEVLGTLSLLDALKLWGQGLAYWLALSAFTFLASVFGGEALTNRSFRESFFGFPWPIALPVLLFVWLRFFHDTSYHQWRWYFPKLKTMGSLLTSLYVSALIALTVMAWNYELTEINRGTGTVNILSWVSVWLSYPGAMFFVLVNEGHRRLMAKREGNADF